MLKSSIRTLHELSDVLKNLGDNDVYTSPVHSLSLATIGQHTRHIIELYQCLLEQYNTGIINYDKRKRDKQIETDVHSAVAALKNISASLDKPDKLLSLQTGPGMDSLKIHTTYFREVLYNLEHCIHHQALIKVGLIELNKTVGEHFGVAPSTLQYRKECAQ